MGICIPTALVPCCHPPLFCKTASLLHWSQSITISNRRDHLIRLLTESLIFDKLRWAVPLVTAKSDRAAPWTSTCMYALSKLGLTLQLSMDTTLLTAEDVHYLGSITHEPTRRSENSRLLGARAREYQDYQNYRRNTSAATVTSPLDETNQTIFDRYMSSGNPTEEGARLLMRRLPERQSGGSDTGSSRQ